jgi:hypothetical protein
MADGKTEVRRASLFGQSVCILEAERDTQTREKRQERDGLQNLLCHTVILWQGARGGGWALKHRNITQHW